MWRIYNYIMPKVELKHKNERFESMLRRFKKAVDRADTLKELRAREAYEKPSAKRKRAKAAAKKRWKKKLSEMHPERPNRRR